MCGKNPQITEGNGQAEEFGSREREDMAEFGGGGSLLYSQSCWRYSRKWNDVYTILFKKDEELKSRFSTSSVGLFFLPFKVHCEQNLVNRVFLHLHLRVPPHVCIISKVCIPRFRRVQNLDWLLSAQMGKGWPRWVWHLCFEQIWRGGAGGGCRGLPLERKPGPHKAASHEDSRGC